MEEHAARTTGQLIREPYRKPGSIGVSASPGPMPVKSSLPPLTRQHLQRARDTPTGRSSRVLNGGRGRSIAHTIVALRAGEVLGDETPTSGVCWTAQILQGRVRLRVGHATCFGWAGDLLVGPGRAHTLSAVVDSALLITTLTPPEDRLLHDRSEHGEC
jgi:hypothetical protein